MEKLNLCKQGADLCSSPVTQLFVAAYFEERAGNTPRWKTHLESQNELYRSRRDAMLEALGEHFGTAASWTKPQGGLFIWATLPEYIDTTDLLARALESEGVAFVPGRSAYLDGRGASSMRLNFAGVPEEEIREGIRRIGKVVREQVGLFGTLTGAEPILPLEPAQKGVDPQMAEVVELPRREPRDAERRSR
jgi:2-aminoadipate transaminase